MRALGIVFMVLLALAVTMAVQVVGTLLLFALVVTPAATALLDHGAAGGRRRIAAPPSGSRRFGSASCSSAMFNLPPSFFIVSLAFLAWITTIAVTRRRWPAHARRQTDGRENGRDDRHHATPAELSV